MSNQKTELVEEISRHEIFQRDFKVRRVNFGDSRMYMVIKNDGIPIQRVFSGYSKWTKDVLPPDVGLLKYFKENEYQYQQERLEQTAVFGTLFQECLVNYEFSRCGWDGIDLFGEKKKFWHDIIEERVAIEHLQTKYIPIFKSRFQDYFIAWFNFKKDHNVNILAAEVPVYCEDGYILTLGDFFLEMDIRNSPSSKKKDFRGLCYLDVKTGSSTDYTDYEYQSAFVVYAAKKTYPNIQKYIDGNESLTEKVIRSFCWNPSGSSLGFSISEKTGKVPHEHLMHKIKENALFGHNNPKSPIYEYSQDGEDVTVKSIYWEEFLQTYNDSK